MAIQDDFNILDKAVKAGKRSVSLPDGRSFNLEDARAERDRLGKEIDKQKGTTAREESVKSQEIQNAEKLVANSKTKLDATLRAFNKGRASDADVTSLQNELAARQESLREIVRIGRNVATKTTAAPVAASAAVSGTKVLGREERGELTVPVPVLPAPSPPVPGKDKSKGDGKKTDDKTVDKTVAPDTSYEAIFKANYPQYNWMFTDLDRVKYADVFDLFKTSVEKKLTDQEFDRRYIGTSFYRELEGSKKGRELAASIGTFSWSSGQLAKFLTKATQFGYEGENLKQKAYIDLFSKIGDKYVNDLAVGEVRASSPYLALKRIGTQYLTSFNDQTVEDALVGGMTADDLLRKSRELAKAMYPHLKDSIDAGVTLEDLSANYKQIAARTLELDPSQVDMGLKFNEALNYTKGGQARMLSLGEWETELRTNDKYRYSFTKQANQDATDIGLAIARAFGKVS